jgi:outer membrane protein
LLFVSSGQLLVQNIHADQQQLKIGFVNPVKLLELSPQGEKALRLLEEEFRPRDQELIDLREKALALEVDLDKNRLVLQASEIKKKQRAIDGIRRKVKRDQQEAREDYNIRRNEELAKLQRLVREMIITIANEEEFDLIVEQAVYVNNRIDLTERILQRLQEE